MSTKFTGIDTDTDALVANAASPLAIVHRLIDNSDFHLYKRSAQTWSWMVGDTDSNASIKPLRFGGLTQVNADQDLARGFLDFLPYGFDYNPALGGLEFSTPPWEPMCMMLPFQWQPNATIDIYITCRVRSSGSSGIPMYVWASAEKTRNVEGQRFQSVTVTSYDNATGRRATPNGDTVPPEAIFGGSPPPNLVTMTPTTNIQIYKVTIVTSGSDWVQTIEPRNTAFIALNFLSTTNNVSSFSGTISNVWYRHIVNTGVPWSNSMGNIRRSSLPGKMHAVLQLSRAEGIDHYYVTQQRPSLTSKTDEGKGLINPYNEDIALVVYPQMDYPESEANAATRMQGVEDEPYRLLHLSYIKVYSISVIETASNPAS